MKKYFALICCICWLSAAAQQTGFYKEEFRPQFHFTPAIHWANDPNGLVYHNGEYHLFYQFNPFGNRWGHMSWGHAVSKDLIHWQHLPLAIPEEKDTMIFSGSCVVDRDNTSGFATKPGQIPMVAVYTAHVEGRSQTQHLAYSLDDGRTWTKYTANPVLDLGKKDFRDPKVFWYAPQKKWIMAVAWPIEKQIQFYASPNLKQWTLSSTFGPAGDTSNIWECPDLFQVPIVNEPGKSKWVLMHSPAPYMQYFVGDFDGTHFKNESQAGKIYRPDYGPDYYAAITFNNLPAEAKPVSIGWVNNWNYANDIPTTPWKSAMSVPRELGLKKINGEWILLQQPVPALTRQRGKQSTWKNMEVATSSVLPVHSQSMELKVELAAVSGSKSGLRIAVGNGKFLEIGYEHDKRILYMDRSQSGVQTFHSSFAKLNRFEAVLPGSNTRLELQVFLDKSILEVFANNGEAVFTMQLFPGEAENGVELFSNEKKVVFPVIHYWPMASVW